jgi:hypothetical protein
MSLSYTTPKPTTSAMRFSAEQAATYQPSGRNQPSRFEKAST